MRKKAKTTKVRELEPRMPVTARKCERNPYGSGRTSFDSSSRQIALGEEPQVEILYKTSIMRAGNIETRVGSG